MKQKYVEIPAPEAPVFARAKRYTRKRQAPEAPAVDPGMYFQHTPAAARSRGTDLTTFNIVLLLIVAAIVITAYISNIVQVDGIMSEITQLQKEENALAQMRENLRAEINMLSSYGRIQTMGTGELGLVHAPQQPYSLTVFGIEPLEPASVVHAK